MSARLSTGKTYKDQLYMLAFVALVLFSGLSVMLWRIHQVNFVSIPVRHASTFTRGDAVITKSIEVKDLQAGEYVSYYDSRDVRRVLTAQVQQVHTTDNTLSVIASGSTGSSQTISSTLLVGKVQYRLAKAGYMLDFIRSRAGLVLCVYLPALVIITEELRTLSTSFGARTYRLYAAAAVRH